MAGVVLALMVLAPACGGDQADATDETAAMAVATDPPTTTTTTTTVLPADPVIVEHGDRTSNQIALTLDSGGRVDPAVDIMEFLRDNDVRSTIFMTGMIAAHPDWPHGSQVLEIVCANPDLFELANHSYHHPRFTDIPIEEIPQELRTTEEAMLPHCDQDPRPLFRPPEGAINDTVARTVADAGYPYIIMWDIDSFDWKPVDEEGPTGPEMADRILDNATGGSIVLMHLGGYNTLEALRIIVPGLRDAGYELVTVGEMLGL